VNDPIETKPQPPTPEADLGSAVVGFILGWVAMIVGVVVNVVFWTVQSSMGMPSPGFIFFGVGSFPLLAMVGLLAWFASKGKSRSVKGVLLAFASMVGLTLLLVAACFGILLSGGFGNMH
jgi:hypothetical protein